MFISDFAIKRPIVTRSSMLALVVFGIFALDAAATPTSSRTCRTRSSSSSIPYPGASPESVEREVIDPHRGRHRRHQRRRQDPVELARRLRRDHHRQFQFEKDLQEATQDIRDAISEIRNELPPEMEEPILTRFDPTDLPIVSLALSSHDADAGRADAARRSRHHPRGCAAFPASPRSKWSAASSASSRWSCGRATLQAAGVERRAGRAGAAVAEPRGAGRPRSTASSTSARSACAGRLEKPADFARLPIAQSQRPRHPPRRRRRRAATAPRSRARRALQRRGGGRHRHQEGEGLQHDAGRRRRFASRSSEIQTTLPQGVTLPRRARRRRARRGARSRTSRRRWSKARLLTVLVVFLFLNSWRSTVITGLALPVSVLASFIAVLGVRLHARTRCRCSACRSRSAS